MFKRPPRLALILGPVALTILCGCGSPTADNKPVQLDPAPVQMPTQSPSYIPTPMATVEPVPVGPNSLFPDSSREYLYVSTRGSDSTGELDWLNDDPLAFHFSAPLSLLGVSTPCNSISGQYTIDDQVVRLLNSPAAGAMGCGSVDSERQAWAFDFISKPFIGSLDGPVLTLTNDIGTIELYEQPAG